jgi:hypothetical protein
MGRVMYDRRTGRPVGPVVRILPEDWPYSDIAPSETLWRYMDFWKFTDLLEKSALYFSRSDQFDDPFEGRFSQGNLSKMSASDLLFHQLYNISLVNKDLEDSQEIMRHVVFISCWHRARKESYQMWQAYTSSPESVAIVTSAKALDSFVEGNIDKSTVKYHEDDFPRTEFSHTSLFFYKPDKFRFEREYRMLLMPRENERVIVSQLGRRVPIRLSKIVHRVISHPKGTIAFKAKVDNLMGQFLKHIKREDSHIPSPRRF